LLKNVLSIYQSKKYLNIFTFIRKCKNVKVLHTTFFLILKNYLFYPNLSYLVLPLSDVITAFVLFENNNNNGLFNFMDYPRIFIRIKY